MTPETLKENRESLIVTTIRNAALLAIQEACPSNEEWGQVMSWLADQSKDEHPFFDHDLILTDSDMTWKYVAELVLIGWRQSLLDLK